MPRQLEVQGLDLRVHGDLVDGTRRAFASVYKGPFRESFKGPFKGSFKGPFRGSFKGPFKIL